MLLHEDEDEESVKNIISYIPRVIFLSNFFACSYFFLHVLRLDVLRRQIEIETESENGYNAGPPMAIPIYTVLPYCVICKPVSR